MRIPVIMLKVNLHRIMEMKRTNSILGFVKKKEKKIDDRCTNERRQVPFPSKKMILSRVQHILSSTFFFLSILLYPSVFYFF